MVPSLADSKFCDGIERLTRSVEQPTGLGANASPLGEKFFQRLRHSEYSYAQHTRGNFQLVTRTNSPGRHNAQVNRV